MADTASIELVHAPVVDLPTRIQTALARIMGCDGGGLHTLTYRERSLLARLTRNISLQDPYRSIRVSVDTLAGALQTCHKTIQRTFNSLREKGWITRDQVKKRSGMQIADTWFTTRALEVLGLTVRPSSRAASDNMSGASSLSTMSEDSQQIPGSSVPETKEFPLPADVQLLEKVGLRRGAIFKLMGEATRAGHRLGNIVRGAAPLIEQAKHVFGYMRKLIASNRDWTTYTCAALRQQVQKEEIRVELELSTVERALVFSALADGVLLTNAAGKTIWLLRYDTVYACPVEDLDRPESKRRYARTTDLVKMADAIRSGKLLVYPPDATRASSATEEN